MIKSTLRMFVLGFFISACGGGDYVVEGGEAQGSASQALGGCLNNGNVSCSNCTFAESCKLAGCYWVIDATGDEITTYCEAGVVTQQPQSKTSVAKE